MSAQVGNQNVGFLMSRLIYCGEEKSVDGSSDQMEVWQRSLSISLKKYNPEDIYNAGKTGLFYSLLPDRTLELKMSTVMVVNNRKKGSPRSSVTK